MARRIELHRPAEKPRRPRSARSSSYGALRRAAPHGAPAGRPAPSGSRPEITDRASLGLRDLGTPAPDLPRGQAPAQLRLALTAAPVGPTVLELELGDGQLWRCVLTHEGPRQLEP
eukprot:7479303-Alexandrium_andersonii.AAC.1